MNINYPYINEYIQKSTPQKTGLLKELETYAEKNNVPISQPETLRFIEVICSIAKPKKILEIGTAIGYSAIAIAELSSEIDIKSIEKSESMATIARENISAAKLDNQIEVITGDAKDVLSEFSDSSFDLIFMDAAKGQYLQFLPHCIRILRNGGILISDNILYQGMVATDELWVKRKCTIIRNLREYITEIMDNDKLDTSILPLGDGVAISYKKI
ncbi:MAG: O-methyltransferase [Oscillospiraceae bacterium]|nr:O-methyltransferase [Oscillospiraceae bacterium]